MTVQELLRTIAISGLWFASFTMTVEAKTNVTSQPLGKMPDGTPVEIFTLSDGAFAARIATYGGIIVSLKVPDRSGKPADVVLGSTTWTDTLPTATIPRAAHFLAPSLAAMRSASRTAVLLWMATNTPCL
jgi:hypothetical protein